MSFCKLGTNLRKYLTNNVLPNKLDSYCKYHDIFYMNNPDKAARNKANIKLEEQAWSRANDASLAEIASAYAVKK